MARRTKQTLNWPRIPVRFRSIQGVRRYVAMVLAKLMQDNELEPDKARVMLYGAKVLADLIEGSDMERRLLAIEEQVAKRQAQPEAVQ